MEAEKADMLIDGEDCLEGAPLDSELCAASYYFVFAQGNSQLKQKADATLGQIHVQNPLYDKKLLE